MKTSFHLHNYLLTTLSIVVLQPQYVLCQYNGELPNFVIDSKGGITKFLKFQIFTSVNDLALVKIPTHLLKIVTKPENILSYSVCTSSRGTQKYLICPETLTASGFNFTQNFCCGISGSQYCCTETEFRQGIQVIRHSLEFSPSILLGCALMTLFAMMVIVLLVYARFYPSNYQEGPVTVVYPESKAYSVRSGTMKSKDSSSVPPSGHLISTDSGRFSSHRMHVHYTGSVV